MRPVIVSMVFTVFVGGAHVHGQAAASSSEVAAVTATVQAFFDTMAAKDVEGSRRVLAPTGRFNSVRDVDGKPAVRTSAVEDYLRTLPAGKTAQRERMWNPEIRVRGSIASVWTPYDFWIDGKFSHCGIDAFYSGVSSPVDTRDVRVVQRSEDAGLAFESRDTISVSEERVRQDREITQQSPNPSIVNRQFPGAPVLAFPACSSAITRSRSAPRRSRRPFLSACCSSRASSPI